MGVEDASILREWDAEKRIWLAGYMREKIQNGGTVMAAFLPEGQLAGFCCVGGDLAGETASYANLLLLFVDDRFKRHGIGRLLLQEACRYAKNSARKNCSFLQFRRKTRSPFIRTWDASMPKEIVNPS